MEITHVSIDLAKSVFQLAAFNRANKVIFNRKVSRAIKVETAREVKRMMVRVISEGTARKFVFVPGYGAGGKTGSAQKSDGPRGYSSSRFISSLVGFVPAEKPRFVIMVLADEPRGSHWGSEVCGPAFESISIEAMRLLRLRDGIKAPAPKAELMVRRDEVKKEH